MKSLVIAMVLILSISCKWVARNNEAFGTRWGPMHERFDDAAKACLMVADCSSVVYIKGFGYTTRKGTKLVMRPGDTTYEW